VVIVVPQRYDRMGPADSAAVEELRLPLDFDASDRPLAWQRVGYACKRRKMLFGAMR